MSVRKLLFESSLVSDNLDKVFSPKKNRLASIYKRTVATLNFVDRNHQHKTLRSANHENNIFVSKTRKQPYVS